MKIDKDASTSIVEVTNVVNLGRRNKVARRHLVGNSNIVDKENYLTDVGRPRTFERNYYDDDLLKNNALILRTGPFVTIVDLISKGRLVDKNAISGNT